VISLAVPAAGWRVVHARRLRHPTISTILATPPSADPEISGAESPARLRRVERLEDEVVFAYGNDRHRAKLAIGFAREKCFERALDMLRAVELWTSGTEGTDGALAATAPHFAGAARVVDLLSALELQLSSPRTLRALIEALVAAGFVDAALQGWRFVFERSVGRKSDEIFDLVAAGATALARIDGGVTLSAMCDAMFEVDAWWERYLTNEPVPSRKWLEFEGGVISGLFEQPGPALSRRGRSRHDDG
jgi:hypothetical protein